MTTVGYIILLDDGTGRAEINHFASMKEKRVVRSVLGAQIFAFSDVVDVAIMLRHALRAIQQPERPLIELTDSSMLFSVVVTSTTTTMKRIDFDVQSAREAFECSDVSKGEWMCRELNPVYGITKVKRSYPFCNYVRPTRWTARFYSVS